MFRMVDAADASKHAVRGLLSRGSWNKCVELCCIVKKWVFNA
ncbi:hypothetical protein [Acetivibrio saccincola]|nr:hypothetical protein [Acetivibrio saccincola]